MLIQTQSFFYDNKDVGRVVHNFFVAEHVRVKLQAVAVRDTSTADNLVLILIYRNSRGKTGSGAGVPEGNYIELNRTTIVVATSVFYSWVPGCEFWVDAGDCISVQSAGASQVQMYGELEVKKR